MTPNSPIALPKISMMRILINRDACCASASAAPEPTIPTHMPQNRLDRPHVIPAPNIANPAIVKHRMTKTYLKINVR